MKTSMTVRVGEDGDDVGGDDEGLLRRRLKMVFEFLLLMFEDGIWMDLGVVKKEELE